MSSAPNLVIVESPAKAKTINKYLGGEYVVEASMGHVRDLPRSRMGLDMANGFEPEYIVMTRARKTVSHLKKLAQGKAGVYLAPDPDREGEAISWHLAALLENCGAKIHRVVFNEITKDAVLQAFKHPRVIDQKLVDAQQARRVMDRVVGYNLSPLLWKKVARGLSAGRVQSVALKFIVEREEEIRNFKPQEYWSIHADLSSMRQEIADKHFRAKLDKINGQKADIKDGPSAEAIKKELEKAPFQVVSISSKTRQRKPQAPYTTSKLQQEAFTRLGFSAQKTMVIAQKLYEGVDIGEEGAVGLITYMRTDSVNVSEQAHRELRKFIGDKFGKDYLPDEANVYKSKKQAQEAHEAIRPTSAFREPERLAGFLEADEMKLYELIWSKFVSSQMKPAIDNVVTIEISASSRYLFKATGSTNIFPGFLLVFQDLAQLKQKLKQKAKAAEEASDGEEDEISGEFPPLKEGEALKLYEIIPQQHFTKPPPRFNDASLVKLLEENGIGRPSTYAPTIQTIVARGYVLRSGGVMRPSELGEQVTKILVEHFSDVMDTKFTAYMEEELDKIAEGRIPWANVVREFYAPFEKDLEQARLKIKDMRREDEPTDYVCDVCGKPMVIKWGRFGKFIACTGFPQCRYTRSIPTGFRCPEPNCNGDLIRLQSKKRRSFFGCSNYPNCRYTTNKLPAKEKEEDAQAA
ncbi:MAG: type I DNA topoisomerase [Candidatus Omnitrophica bacterium]|nr:type I DNA topoisomerase [Candidatus Omnitrophota bacterium]